MDRRLTMKHKCALHRSCGNSFSSYILFILYSKSRRSITILQQWLFKYYL